MSQGPDVSAIRTEYARAGLSERDLSPSPLAQVGKWLQEAIDAGHPEPNAFVLATVTAEGDPAARVVLARSLDERGVVFFTNYESAKGRDLAAKPRASACFFWPLLERQIRLTGSITKVARAESEAYFATRPRGSQLGAWASAQSTVVAGRAEIDAHLAETRARFGDGPVACPPGWGGYLLAPERVELWQGRPSRLHDRLVYTRTGAASWRIDRLSP